MATAAIKQPTDRQIENWLRQFNSQLPVPFMGMARRILCEAYLKAHSEAEQPNGQQSPDLFAP